MARKYLTALDLQKNEIQNARVQNLASAPGSPVAGQIYYDTSTSPGVLYWYDGSAWVAAKAGAASFGSVVTETSYGQASNDGVASTSARSDHTHGTPAHGTAQHSSFSLSTFAAPTADIGWGNFKITGLGSPSAGTDAANKNYVDGVAQGLDFKSSVRVATTANGTLASAFANGQSVDGVTLATGDRILIKNQSTASENGIYIVAASGAPTRATDADASGELSAGALVYVEAGTTNGTTQWVVASTTATPWVPGSSGSTWSQFSGASTATAGSGLTASGNVFNVGAGTGISVAADAVAVDTAVVARKFLGTLTGGATSEVVTHNLGNQWVLVQVANNNSPFDLQELDVELTSTNTVTVRSSANLPAGLRVTIIG